MLGQLFLLACVIAIGSIAVILFIVFGPVPVKRRVMVVPRLSTPEIVATAPAAPSLVAQLAPAVIAQDFAPTIPDAAPHRAHATPPPPPVAAPKKGGKVQPLPRKRAAKGTGSPFAPVVNRSHRQFRDEDVATNPVRRVFDSEELTRVDDAY